MRGCSKLSFRLFIGLVLSTVCIQALAAPAVLIEENRSRGRNHRIESDIQAEPEWNREVESQHRGPASESGSPSSSDTQFMDRTPIDQSPQIQNPEAGGNDSLQPQTRRRIQRSPLVGRTSIDGKSMGFPTASELRKSRRMGIGPSFLGRAGFIGLDAELNVHTNHSVLASVGGGPGYNAASLGYKWLPFSGRWHPTFSLSMASWLAESDAFKSETAIPAFFRAKPGQSADERLRQVYLIPGIGIQALQLQGPGVGGMIFAEFLFFADVSTFALSPIGSVGARYFF